jgi:prenyltransferase beta subunit
MNRERSAQNIECGWISAEYCKETACGFALPTADRPAPTANHPLPTVHCLFLIAFVFFPFLAALKGLAEENEPEKAAGRLITPAAQKSIDQALRWLAQRQHEDGSFGAGPARGNVAVCGLAGMAFMSGGSTPGRGPYGTQVNKCIDYILVNTQPSGFINGPDTATHGPMYGHGFATMFLAECFGMSPRPELRDKLAKAVKLIVDTQNKEGGWRYFPRRDDADISVTVCEIMALRAARNAGFFVPKDVINNATNYVKRSQNPDGGFMYMVQGGESAFPRSAAAVVALYSLGIYEGPEINKGLDYLMDFLPAEGTVRRENYYYYGHYYAAQAFWQAGAKPFGRWFPAVRDELVAKQHEDGSWLSAAEGTECATAMACIVLQIPNNYLPILQR